MEEVSHSVEEMWLGRGGAKTGTQDCLTANPMLLTTLLLMSAGLGNQGMMQKRGEEGWEVGLPNWLH